MDELKVLVAEDEPLIRSSIIRKIGSIGPPFSVVAAVSDGELALVQASTLFPDIVITDIRMPEVNGLEVASRLKQSYPVIQIIVVTGYDDFSYARTALRSGVLDFLVKPVGGDELRRALLRAKEEIDLEYNAVDSAIRGRTTRPPSGDNLVRAMNRYVTENSRSKLTVADIARVFGYSPDHVTRLFERHAGTTPSRQIATIRVREGVRLLRAHPDVPIGQIAEQMGFEDPGHFSRVVRRVSGKTPRQIRQEPKADGDCP